MFNGIDSLSQRYRVRFVSDGPEAPPSLLSLVMVVMFLEGGAFCRPTKSVRPRQVSTIHGKLTSASAEGVERAQMVFGGDVDSTSLPQNREES